MRKRCCGCASALRTVDTRTLEEVGKEFNVTRERIRQIEAKALRKLRHPVAFQKAERFPELTRAAAQRSGITRTAVTSKKHRKSLFPVLFCLSVPRKKGIGARNDERP